jgi:hypothetical protein
LADIHSEVLKHQTYSTDLARSDYYLFPNLNIHLKGSKYSNNEEATLAAQSKEFFFGCLKKLEQRSHKCVELRGEYVE